MRLYLAVAAVGLVLGIAAPRALAQTGRILFGRDSVSGKAVVVQTNGTNSLKVEAH